MVPLPFFENDFDRAAEPFAALLHDRSILLIGNCFNFGGTAHQDRNLGLRQRLQQVDGAYLGRECLCIGGEAIGFFQQLSGLDSTGAF
jgi:hypothetical protein